MKKYIMFALLIFILNISIVSAKTIRTCTYNANPDSYDGTKFILKITDKYNYSLYLYNYDHNKFSYNAGIKLDVKNWNNDLEKSIKSNNKCPTYLVNAPNFNAEDKIYLYFDKKKAEEKAKEGFLWLGYKIKITEDKKETSSNNVEDKEDGTSDVENNNGENIKEFKKTYKVGKFSSSVNGDSVIFYTKYNYTTKSFLSTQIQVPSYDGKVGLVYNGDINKFKNNVLFPIVNENKWPTNMYCGQISMTLKISPSAQMILGTADNGNLVCSTDKSSFIDSNNNLSGFEANNDNKSDKCENAGKGGCLPEGSKGGAVTDVCSILSSDIVDFIKKIVGYLQIGTVFLALVLGILDFVGAIGSDKDNAFKDAGKKFLKRLIAVALVFLVPAIIGIILNFVSVANDCNIDIFG